MVSEQETEPSPLVVPLGVVPLGEEPSPLVVSHVVAQDEEPVLARNPLVVPLGEVPSQQESSPLVVPLVPEWIPGQQVEPVEQRTLGSVSQEPGLPGQQEPVEQALLLGRQETRNEHSQV